jgi:3'-phosphoadenosine 5'-phosphosulfate sulfotransferase (PAPS reductase)/FAD synthetase
MIQVSISGGRSSAMMARIMIDNYDKSDLVFTFANTGKELPQTLDFVNECDLRWSLNTVWLEYCPIDKFKVVDYSTASRSGEPFERILEKRKYLPNRVTRFCTTELKIKPMHNYLKSLGFNSKWDCAVGIRYDEENRYRRLKSSNQKLYDKYLFPLYDFKVTKKEVVQFWANQDFDLQIPSEHGNCDLCFMKGVRKRSNQARQMPGILDWWNKMEVKYNARFDNEYSVATIKYLSSTPQLFEDLEPNLSCFCGD